MSAGAVEVKHFLDPQEIKGDVGFTEATLDDNMIEQGALVAHYGVQVSRAQHQMDTMKMMLEIREAQVAQQIRDQAVEDGKKITEKAIEQQLMINPRIIAMKKAVNEAKAHYEACRTALEALRHKKDMMIQIGVSRRTELEQHGRILERQDRMSAGEAKERDTKHSLEERAKKLSQR